MAVEYMQPSQAALGDKGIRWEHSNTAAGTTTAGNTIMIPAGAMNIAVTVKVGSGATCKVQASTDSKYTLENDSSNVTWIDWSKGTIGTSSQDTLSAGASAIRLYSVSGTNASTIIVSAK